MTISNKKTTTMAAKTKSANPLPLHWMQKTPDSYAWKQTSIRWY
jgi:hypothetical protein